MKPRASAPAVVFAIAWGVFGVGGFIACAFYLVIIMLEVRWTALTQMLLFGVGPLLALFGGLPAAIFFRRGEPAWKVALAIAGALALVPVLVVLVLLSTERVH